MPGKEKWRMTLQELCHRAGARPADLERWAKLGALGPSWQETTENKWRHITKKCANRAIVMRALLDSSIDETTAAELANSLADRLAAGEKLAVRLGNVAVDFDPENMDLE